MYILAFFAVVRLYWPGHFLLRIFLFSPPRPLCCIHCFLPHAVARCCFQLHFCVISLTSLSCSIRLSPHTLGLVHASLASHPGLSYFEHPAFSSTRSFLRASGLQRTQLHSLFPSHVRSPTHSVSLALSFARPVSNALWPLCTLVRFCPESPCLASDTRGVVTSARCPGPSGCDGYFAVVFFAAVLFAAVFFTTLGSLVSAVFDAVSAFFPAAGLRTVEAVSAFAVFAVLLRVVFFGFSG